jgi:uncharacterized membrane protein YagU involved in acid resistance
VASQSKPAGTEPLALLRLALAAAALLVAYILLAPHLPRLSLRPSLVVSLVVSLVLVSLMCVGLLPLRGMGHWTLLVAAVGAALGALTTAFGWVAIADPSKVLFAAALGFWLAEQITSPALVVGIAVLAAVADIVSVAVGPTKALLEHAPGAIGYFTLAFAWPGRDPAQAFTALGVSDAIFFCLYLCAARRFHLRTAATVVGMALSIVVSVVIGLRVSAVPALPLLGVAFVGVNADLLWHGGRPGRRP